jgi:quaternary ammonium compound-resistance protein SugE
MAWFYLFLAGACEMAWPLGFKYTNGFNTHVWAIALTMATMLLSFWLMSLAVRHGIHVGTAYAVWTGLGAAGTAVLGMILFSEPRDVVRLGCLSLIIAGVIGLKFLSPPEQPAAAPGAAAENTAREEANA